MQVWRVFPDGTPLISKESPNLRGDVMGVVVLLLLLALLFGGLGLFIEGLKWALIIALVLVIAGAFSGYRGRRVV